MRFKCALPKYALHNSLFHTEKRKTRKNLPPVLMEMPPSKCSFRQSVPQREWHLRNWFDDGNPRARQMPICSSMHPHTRRTLTLVAAVAAHHRAAVLLCAALPAGRARQTDAVAGARCTAHRAAEALLALLVRIVAVRAGVAAAAVQRESTRTARDALRFRRAVAGGARRVARGAAV